MHALIRLAWRSVAADENPIVGMGSSLVLTWKAWHACTHTFMHVNLAEWSCRIERSTAFSSALISGIHGLTKATEAHNKLKNAYEVLMDSLKLKIHDDELGKKRAHGSSFRQTSPVDPSSLFTGETTRPFSFPSLSRRGKSMICRQAFVCTSYGFRVPAAAEKPEWRWKTLSST